MRTPHAKFRLQWITIFVICLAPMIVLGQGRFPEDQGVTWIGDQELHGNYSDLLQADSGFIALNGYGSSYWFIESDSIIQRVSSIPTMALCQSVVVDSLLFQFSWGLNPPRYYSAFNINNNLEQVIEWTRFDQLEFWMFHVSIVDSTCFDVWGNVYSFANTSQPVLIDSIITEYRPNFNGFLGECENRIYLWGTGCPNVDTLFVVHHCDEILYELSTKLPLPDQIRAGEIRPVFSTMQNDTLFVFGWRSYNSAVRLYRFGININDRDNPEIIESFYFGYNIPTQENPSDKVKGRLVNDSLLLLVNEDGNMITIASPFSQSPEIADTLLYNTVNSIGWGTCIDRTLVSLFDRFYLRDIQGILEFHVDTQGSIVIDSLFECLYPGSAYQSGHSIAIDHNNSDIVRIMKNRGIGWEEVFRINQISNGSIPIYNECLFLIEDSLLLFSGMENNQYTLNVVSFLDPDTTFHAILPLSETSEIFNFQGKIFPEYFLIVTTTREKRTPKLGQWLS